MESAWFNQAINQPAETRGEANNFFHLLQGIEYTIKMPQCCSGSNLAWDFHQKVEISGSANSEHCK